MPAAARSRARPPRRSGIRWRTPTRLASASTPRPARIQAIAQAGRDIRPRTTPKIEPQCRLAGLEPFNIGPDSMFVNVGERTNVTGSAAFKKLILNKEYDKALEG